MQNLGAIFQMGILTDDIERSIDAWMDKLNVGPWTLTKNIPLKCSFRGGEVREPVIHCALGYVGDMEIELIQQVNDEPSPYLEDFQAGRMGLHHMGYLCDDVNKTTESALSAGMEVACDIRMFDVMRFTYLEDKNLGGGTYLELVDRSFKEETLKTGIQAAQKWNGSKDIVVMDFNEGVN